MPAVHQPQLFDPTDDKLLEDPHYLSQQIITYLGNKRALLPFIGHAVQKVKERLAKRQIDIFEPFTGSGIVARALKQHASRLVVNDLEDYTVPIGQCYLANQAEVSIEELTHWNQALRLLLESPDRLQAGFLTELYAPHDESSIQPGERVFYTPENARRIDTARQFIDTVPHRIRPFLLAPLLAAASVHANTGGVFKGFYKDRVTGIGCYGGRNGDALTRIRAPIRIPLPMLSRFSAKVEIHQGDAADVARVVRDVDLAYLDPPYNQHPYGSNYFMLNLITNYQRPTEISRVSGIPICWKRSNYNRRQHARAAFWDVVTHIRAKYILVSYNAEGFIQVEEMVNMLESLGSLTVFQTQYNTFRACRNLASRPKHVTEYIFLVEAY